MVLNYCATNYIGWPLPAFGTTIVQGERKVSLLRLFRTAADGRNEFSNSLQRYEKYLKLPNNLVVILLIIRRIIVK
jgi:hypothetical protein